MKEYLLPKNGNFYKANLHCHSTVSDCELTPEQIKKAYTEKGYSIVAFTDHDLFVPHDYLNDENFLALHGFEMEIKGGEDKAFPKYCHFCLIALSPDNLVQPMWNEDYLFWNGHESMHLVKRDETQPPYVRRYDGKSISEMMQIGRDAGFFVTYNHPAWSRETYNEYINYNGMHAMEMFNGYSLAEGYEDYNPRVYDDILSSGKQIYCIAGDDTHCHRDKNSRMYEIGRAFTVIKAEKLEYTAITDALLKGHFYASEGPEIYELWKEDGKIHIECSEADRVTCTYKKQRAEVVYDEGDSPVTKADFTIAEDDGYARITVIDKSGKHACTNAIFV